MGRSTLNFGMVDLFEITKPHDITSPSLQSWPLSETMHMQHSLVAWAWHRTRFLVSRA
jgi:hypothetical protein